jgi:hypothetical protein
VVVTVALVFTEGSAENGTVAAPLVAAAVFQVVVWGGVLLGLLRVWRACARRNAARPR